MGIFVFNGKNNFTIKEVKQLGINKDYNHYIIVLKK